MKKLLLTLALMVSVLALSAQSFRVVTEDGRVVERGETFYIYGQGNAWGELFLNLSVEALEDIELIAEKIEIQNVHDTYNMLCLDMCYSPTVYVTPVVSFAAGDTKEFSMHYQYDNNIDDVAGLEQIIEYRIYGSDESADQFFITVIFKYSLEGVQEHSYINEFSNAYPSPACDVVNFDYSFNSNVNAEIAIYNMMGQEVMRNQISGIQGKASLNVSDLTDGVYFYSLIVNGKSERSSKLVVSR